MLVCLHGQCSMVTKQEVELTGICAHLLIENVTCQPDNVCMCCCVPWSSNIIHLPLSTLHLLWNINSAAECDVYRLSVCQQQHLITWIGD